MNQNLPKYRQRTGLRIIAGLFLLLLCTLTLPVAAEDVFQTQEDFVAEAFDGEIPKPEIFWVTGDLKEGVARIMGDHYKLLRTRYWEKDGRTAWVLEDIGKVKPITSGFVVNEHGQIEYIKVLVYRESHGWEVRYPFFTDQFRGMALDKQGQPDRHIDGISGATLSVGALSRMSRLALYLHSNRNR